MNFKEIMKTNSIMNDWRTMDEESFLKAHADVTKADYDAVANRCIGKRKKPYTNIEFFDIVKKMLEKNNELPEKLDYIIGSSKETPIISYECDVQYSVSYGGSEGIYVTFFLEYSPNNRLWLGTAKTLLENKEALRFMATLGADFIYYGTKFLNDNLDDFLWDDKWVVRYMEGDEYKQGNVYGRTPFRKAIPDFVSNIKRMLEYHPEYTSVIIIEADTRKVSELTKEEILEY